MLRFYYEQDTMPFHRQKEFFLPKFLLRVLVIGGKKTIYVEELE